MIAGVAVNLNSAAPPASPINLIVFYEGATLHTDVCLNTDLSISVRRSSTALGTSAAGVIPGNGYAYVEFKCNIHDTTGSYDVRINNVSVLSGTNKDTRNGATGVINTVGINFPVINMYFDDFYVCDTAGSVNNDFLGDVRVDAYLPNGNGNSSQFVGSDADSTNNYLLVDDPTDIDDDTTYVESSTVSNKDTYAIADMSHVPSTIHGVQVCASAKKDDAGARTMAIVTRSGGTDYDSSAYSISTSYLVYRNIRETDPNTSSAWSKTNLNSAEFGVKVSA
jgi:hypothetical protein